MKIYQKESVQVQLEVLDSNDQIPDLTNAEFRFRLRSRTGSDGQPSLYEKTCVLMLPNMVILNLNTDDTELPCGRYIQEWRLFDSVTDDVITVYQGDFIVAESQFDELVN